MLVQGVGSLRQSAMVELTMVAMFNRPPCRTTQAASVRNGFALKTPCLLAIHQLLKHVETLRFRLVNWGEHAGHPESLRKAVLRKAAPVGTWNVLFWNLRNLHWCPGTLCCFPLHISTWTSFCGSQCARWKGKTSMKGHLPFFSSIAHQITCATHVLLGIWVLFWTVAGVNLINVIPLGLASSTIL